MDKSDSTTRQIQPDHTCPPWADECKDLSPDEGAHTRRPNNGADVEIYCDVKDEAGPYIYVGAVADQYTAAEAVALGTALVELGHCVDLTRS